MTAEQDDGCRREARLAEHQRKWLGRLQACEASGKSVTAYATEHGFPDRALYDAKKVLVRKGVLARTQQTRFQRLKTTAAVWIGGEWRVQLPSGVSVEFSGNVDAGSISTVRNTMARLG